MYKPAHAAGLPPYDDSDPNAIIGDPNFVNGLPPHRAESAAEFQTQILEVPILTILPIPFIRIDQATIDFNDKITSTTYKKTDTSLKLDTELEVSYGGGLFSSFLGSAKFKVNTSYQRNTTQGYNVRGHSL